MCPMKRKRTRPVVDPVHVVDVTRCFAILGKDKEHVGRQCLRQPRAGKFFCAEHIKLDKSITGGLRDSLYSLRETARALKGERARTVRTRLLSSIVLP